MKSLKYILLFLAAAVTFTACEEEWTPGEPDAAQSVYFPSDIRSFTLGTEDTSVEFPVYRATAGEAISVNLLTSVVDPTTDAETDLFTVPATVSFPAGEMETTYTITFDVAQLEAGVKYEVLIQVKDAEFRGNYGISSLSFTIGLPEPWVSLGEGIYRDNFYNALVSGLDPGYMALVDIQQHAIETHRVRAYGVFGRNMMAAFYGGIPEFVEYHTEDMSLEFDMTDSEAIIINGDSNATFGGSPAQSVGFYLDGLNLHLVMNDATKLGVYRDGIISFPHANSFYIIDENYYGLYGNDSGLLAFALPGASFVDPSISADYVGMNVNAQGEAKALIEFTLGFDVTSYKFVVLEEDATATAEEVIAGILDGTLEEGVFVAEDASQLAWELDIKKGYFTIVAVPYIGEDSYDAYVEKFYFPGADDIVYPEFDGSITVGSIAGITGNPEYEASYPCTSTMGILLQSTMGDAIKSIKYYVTGEKLDPETADEVYLTNGNDASTYIEQLIEKGYGIMVFQKLEAGATVNVIVGFETVFGTFTFRETYTLPTEAPVAPETPEEGEEGEEGEDEAGQASIKLAPRIVKDVVPYYGEIKHVYTVRQAQSLR